ncbi:hypothetical protein Tco_0848285 [Tanacetum coccineum]
MPQKEETFQVVIDVIKNSTCFKAFTISADVLEIFMQQFWYTIKKVQGTDSYEFLLANKMCRVNAKVFKMILDICLRVKGEEFTELQNDDDTITFLIDLGYKGPLHKYTNMYVDYMSQPCRTLAAIINKCLFGKTASNDRLRKSKIDIMWCLFYRENVEYLELIWEDLAYQIKQRRERKSRRENMSYLRFTKVIINHFLKQHKSLSNLKYQHYHTIKDDGIVSRLKFVRIGEDYQEYGLAIPEVMLNDAIKQSESYQMFIKYSTSQIPSKKSRGKGSQGKKIVDDSQETVDVSEESEPKLIKKKTASRRVVKKKVTISADDNIIHDPDVALELGKSISLAKAEEEEAAKQVHATHAGIMTEYVPKSAKKKTGSRSSRSVVIQDTLNVMQALKESKKTNNRQPGTGGSSEGTVRIPGVPDESTIISATSSEGTSTKPGVPDEEKVSTEEKVILEWGSKKESKYSEEDLNEEEDIDLIDYEEDDKKKDDTDDDKSIDLEMIDDEETDDEVLQGKEQANDDKDEEMLNVEVEDSKKGDAKVSDAAKADAEKTKEAKDDSNKAELPPISSSLSISSDISSLLDIMIQSKVLNIQSPSMLKVPMSMISKPSVLTPVQETPLAAPVPSIERVKISSTNLRLETTVPQKEETFQVVIDVIKNSTCFKAFTISADVPEIFMHQFWYTSKKVQGTDSYEFLLANKMCRVNAEVFKKILDICLRVKGEEFTELQNDDDTITFLIDLGYKGPLHKYTNIENVDYPELIWEDFAYQIDHKRERKSRRENMPYPRFTKVIISYFLKQHKSLSNLKYQHYHTIKDDGIVSQLKFVRIGEDYQEYGLAIPDVILNDAIKQSESYQMFIKYSTESEPEPEPVKKKTTSRRVVKKKVTISADDNIIHDPDVALELGKSISLAKAEEEEAAKQVHATHAGIMTEYVPKSAKKKTGSRSSRSVVIQDTLNVMQALKESKKTNNRQPGTEGSSEGTVRIPGVPDESTVISATSSEGTSTKPGVPDKEKVTTEEKVILEWGSKKESEYSEEDLNGEEDIDLIDSEEDDKKKDDTDDDKSIDLEMIDDEETDDEVLQGKEQANDDEDEEMLNVEVEDSEKGDAEVFDAAKADAEKTEEAKDDSNKAELPLTSSSLSISLGVLHAPLQQSTVPIPPLPIINDAPIITYVVPESDVLFVFQLRVAKLEKDVSGLKKIDHSAKSLATLKSQVPTVVKQYLESKIGDDLQKVLQRCTTDLIHKYSMKPALDSSKIQTSTINLEQESKKSASEILKIKKEHTEK